MTCPKCGSGLVLDARDEAPIGANDWRRCLCGKRWDPTTTVQRPTNVELEDDDEQDDAAESDDLGDPDDEDDDRSQAADRIVRAIDQIGSNKEKSMRGPWTKEQREKFMETMRRKPGGRQPHERAVVPAQAVEVDREINAVSRMATMRGGDVLPMLDAALAEARADCAALERTREILRRHVE